MSAEQPKGACWVVRVPVNLFDGHTEFLSDRGFRMMFVLEGFAREKAWCRPSNERLAELLHRTARAIQQTLEELEHGGWITRVMETGPKPVRIGFLLLRRLDPDRPAATLPGDREFAERALRGAAAQHRSEASVNKISYCIETSTKKNAPSRAKNSSPSSTKKIAPELRGYVEKDKSLKEAEISPHERNAPKGKLSLAVGSKPLLAAPASAPEPPPAPPEPASPQAIPGDEAALGGFPRSELGPAHLQALCALSTEEIAELERAAPQVRADFLAWFRVDVDEILLRELKSKLRPRVQRLHTPPPDAQVPALLNWLAEQRNTAFVAPIARALLEDLEDHNGSWKFHFGLCEQLCMGQRRLESIIEPYERIAKLRKQGKPPEKPAALFARLVAQADQARASL